MDAINLDDLADAFEDASPVMPYFLDRDTGDILLVADALGFIDAELVVGLMIAFTSETRLAGKPPCFACSRTIASLGAM